VAVPRIYRTEAIVLRRHDLGETDRIVTLYTDKLGKIRAIAKGVRRPTSRLGGHLELFTHSRLMLARGRNLDVITQVDAVETHVGLREDLFRAGLAYCAAELVDRLTEDQSENVALFDALRQALGRIATDRRPGEALQLFELTALSVLGFRPELYECVHCRQELQPVDNTFSPASGGVLCPDCRAFDLRATSISANALKVLRLYVAGNWTTASRLRIDDTLAAEIDAAIKAYTTFVVETQLKSEKFVAALRREGVVAAT
jgi:DNA repair protein RecO (recombination protein O)